MYTLQIKRHTMPMKLFSFILMGLISNCCLLASTSKTVQAPINRKLLVSRNNPVNTTADTLASLSVGNGKFAFTTDITGLQTFPEHYSRGVPLGTQSEWGPIKDRRVVSEI